MTSTSSTIPIYSNTLLLPSEFGSTKATSYKTSLTSYKRLLDCLVEDPNRSWYLKQLPAALREHHTLIAEHRDIVEGTDAEGQSLM